VSLLHLVAAELLDDAPDEAVQQALAYAGELAGAEGVTATCFGRSERQLVAAVWLDDARALEPFAASPEHMSFIMRGLASVIRGMWSASVTADGAVVPDDAAALWLFAVPQFEGVFEWEVRKLLDEVAVLPGVAWSGATVEERERYRAGGAVLLTEAQVEPFGEALTTARAGWGGLAERVEQALVGPVVITQGTA